MRFPMSNEISFSRLIISIKGLIIRKLNDEKTCLLVILVVLPSLCTVSKFQLFVKKRSLYNSVLYTFIMETIMKSAELMHPEIIVGSCGANFTMKRS